MRWPSSSPTVAVIRAISLRAIDDVVVSVCNELADRDTPVHLLLDDLHVVHNVIGRRSVHQFVLAAPPASGSPSRPVVRPDPTGAAAGRR